MSLKIKSLSLKINVVNLFCGGTFGAGLKTKWKNLIFYILRDPALKMAPQNKRKQICFEDTDLMFKLI